MEIEKMPLRAQPGEMYGAQKQRFVLALAVVAQFMDRFYSGPTLRRFVLTPSQVRNIKQCGVVNWEVLEYWANEYVPATQLPEAWATPVTAGF
jgi:hypothetical protein